MLNIPYISWTDEKMIGAPTHRERPFAMKAYALKAAEAMGYTSLLWADSCIVLNNCPPDRIFEHAEQHGAWLSRNGFTNFEWTANSAYEALGVTPEENKSIEHVVAGAFALDLKHPNGRAFLDEYFRLASETNAFCGPSVGGIGVQHRHDQTAASVIAWRLGIPLTSPPDMLAYKGGETDQTVLIADGTYQ
jgi:hypothetical protein